MLANSHPKTHFSILIGDKKMPKLQIQKSFKKCLSKLKIPKYIHCTSRVEKMARLQIQKSFQKCLSKIKTSRMPLQIQFRIQSCNHPKTPSFDLDEKRNEENAEHLPEENTEHFPEENAEDHTEENAITLSDIDKFLFENFRSLYQKEYEEEISKKNEAKMASFLLDPTPGGKLRSNSRFFISSSRSLIMDGASSSSSSDDDVANEPSRPEDFISLLTYSNSKYEDFRRSMQEMVEARMEHNGKVDWDFMEELLFCYLDLNNKKSYGFILRAFVDLVVVLRENSGRIPARSQPWIGRGRIGKRQLKGEM